VNLNPPSLAMSAAPGQALPGSLVTYTLQIGNPSPSGIPSVTTTTGLAAAAEFVSVSTSQGQASYDAATHTVVFTITALAPGETVTLTIEVRLAATAPAGTQVTAITSATLAGVDCVQAATGVTITPAGIPVTGFGPGPRELMLMGLAALGGVGALLAAGWVIMRRAVRQR
jgi:hypothetical protein